MKHRTGLFVTAALILTVLFPAVVSAASAAVSMSGNKVANIGDTITVTVTYRGDSLGYVNGHLTYNTDALEYVSGGSSRGNTGLVQLKTYADNAGGKLSFKVKFRAAGAGSAKLNLETLETQNLDGDADMGTPSAGMTVKIAEVAESRTSETESSSTAQSRTVESSDTEPSEAAESSEITGESENQMPEKNILSYLVLLIAGLAVIVLIVLVVIRMKKK